MTIEKFNETCIKICEADPSLRAKLYRIIHDWGYSYDMGTGFHPVPAKVLASAAINAISYNYKPEILQSPFILTTECDDFVQKLLAMKYTLDPVRTETEPKLKEIFEDKCLNVCPAHSPIKFTEVKNPSFEDAYSRLKDTRAINLRVYDELTRLVSMPRDSILPKILSDERYVPKKYDNKENTNMEKFIKVNAKKIEDATNTWIDGYIVCKNSERFYPGDIYCYENTVDIKPDSYLQYISDAPMSTNLLVYGSAEGLASKMPASYLKDFSNLAIYKVSAYVNRAIAVQIQSKILTTYGTSDFVVEECICDNFDINEFINENNDLLHVFEYFTFGNNELTPDVEKIVSKLSVDINGIHSFVSDILLMKPSIRKWMKRANHTLYTSYNSSHDVLNCLLNVENLIDRAINIINMMNANDCTVQEIVTTFMNYKL